jgi:hypothetical protein
MFFDIRSSAKIRGHDPRGKSADKTFPSAGSYSTLFIIQTLYVTVVTPDRVREYSFTNSVWKFAIRSEIVVLFAILSRGIKT